MKKVTLTILLLMLFTNLTNGQEMKELSNEQEKIVTIAAYTAIGDLDRLEKELNAGLNTKLSINQVKEILVHLYAYCGFPRSLQGINKLKTVAEQRNRQGINDIVGSGASPIADNRSRYERGEENQIKVTGQTAEQLKNGFSFTPIMDVFLKEHLFADIFDRDILTFQEREIVTVSALASMNGVEPMLQAHIIGALNVGVTQKQLEKLFNLIEIYVGRNEANIGRTILNNTTITN